MGSRPDTVESVPDPTGPCRLCPPEPAQWPPNLISAATAAVAALSELARFPAAKDAARLALTALSQLGPIIGHLPSAGEVVKERESARNEDMTGYQIATGVEQGRDSSNVASQVISSHEASKGSGNNASNQQQNIAWCEVCRVGCNSLQILEQHKNGKRHKKSLQRIEELKRVGCVSANTQDLGTSRVGAVIEGEAAGKIPYDIDLDLILKNGYIAVQSPRNSTEPSDQKSSPCKKRESNGNGTIPKRAKNVVAAVVCSVCNVKCDTREVFDKHLSGKKHISKVKRSQGRQPTNREIGLRAVYLNNPMSRVPPSEGGEYRQFLIPEGSYLPPRPQAYMSLPPQGHYQVDTTGNASVGSFQHPVPQALEGSVSLNHRHYISQSLPGVQQW